jgi:hypothetical protein
VNPSNNDLTFIITQLPIFGDVLACLNDGCTSTRSIIIDDFPFNSVPTNKVLYMPPEDIPEADLTNNTFYDFFYFKATDGNVSSVPTMLYLTVLVIPKTSPPSATPGQSVYETDEDKEIVLTLGGTDLSGDPVVPTLLFNLPFGQLYQYTDNGRGPLIANNQSISDPQYRCIFVPEHNNNSNTNVPQTYVSYTVRGITGQMEDVASVGIIVHNLITVNTSAATVTFKNTTAPNPSIVPLDTTGTCYTNCILVILTPYNNG